MAVVIRLQGLSIAAGSQDIRKFFSGLRIPDGGVHIVGGELDEAFIIFGSDEDARIAMTKSGNYIKGSPVKLLLSSKTEMQNVLERSSMNLGMDQRKMLNDKPRHMKMEEMRGPRRSADHGRPSGRLGYSPPIQHRRASGFEKERQLMLRGMPFSVTEKDVLKFFEGLAVEKVVLMQNNRGQNNGNGLVAFASKEDANHGLKRHKQYIGTRFVEIYTLKEWQQVSGEIPLGASLSGMSQRQQQPPPRSQEDSQYHGRSRSPLVRGSSPSSGEYCVLLDNLSFSAEKHDIMKFFSRIRLGSDQILYLLNDKQSAHKQVLTFCLVFILTCF
uniref:RRM domain-containing protein n=1 Tax=Periophthalmus magnuspinnatus TaxID=409849 RepID=A0A3B4AF03_9GOBI